MQRQQGRESVSVHIMCQRHHKCNYITTETDMKWTFSKRTQLGISPQLSILLWLFAHDYILHEKAQIRYAHFKATAGFQYTVMEEC